MRSRTLSLLAALVLLPACIEVIGLPEDDNGGPRVDLEQSDSAPPRSPIADIVESALESVVNVTVRTGTGEGQGSGVVIDDDGTVLTNFHVVECSVDVTVFSRVGDERIRMEGRVLGGIPEKDLAVIKVDDGDLPAIDLGRSSRLRLGDEVVAIGFPLGLGGGATVTKGIVSALDRTIQAGSATGEERELQGLLQTDAAINPGNSGGALIDRAGRLVGINTAAARASDAENIGFAIQIDEALPIVEEILSEPAEERAWLGVSVAPIESAFDATQFGVDSEVRGAGVAATFSGDPAAESGIEEGEVIVEIAGRAVRSGDDLTEVLTDLDPGDEVDVALVSANGRRTVSVTLGTRPPTIC